MMYMKIQLDGLERNILIIRKRSNKNTYIRVKDDLTIYITTNYFVKNNDIIKLIKDNKKFIIKMTNKKLKQKKIQEEFMYLGKKYDIVLMNSNHILLGEDKIFVSSKDLLDKWLRKQANIIFLNELDRIFNNFYINIPYPSLTIRNMKTRWGVCNVKSKRITLNLELIKKDKKYLDYVIVHELSHLIYPNHSKLFWNLVSRLVPNYKILRKELNNYES